MIVISKVLFGSVAVASLVGSVMIPDAAGLMRGLASSLHLPVTVADEALLVQVAQDDTVASPAAQQHLQPPPFPIQALHLSPHTPTQCSGPCDVFALMAQSR